MFKKSARGFTFIELLIVVTIIGILVMIVVYFFINPVEILKRARDTTRLTDLQNLKQAITVTMAEQDGSNLVCFGGDLGCTDKSNSSSTTKKLSDGSGWVKINLKDNSSIPMPTLPLDPSNNGTYHYTYCGVFADGEYWEINTVLESKQESPKMLNINDGGNEDDKYELGSSLAIIAPEGQGNCIY